MAGNPLYAVADTLLKWNVLRNMGVRDVVVDRDTVALVAEPLKVELAAVKTGIRSPGFYINNDFAALFGIPIEKGHGGYGTRPMWWHSDEGTENLEDFLTGMESAIRDAVSHMTGDPAEEESVRVVLLVEPGYPFNPNETKTNYSAKKKKEYAVSMPPYAMRVKDEQENNKEVWAVNFCKFLPVVCANGPDAIVGRLGEQDFLVTHATQMHSDKTKVRDDSAEIIAQCPGMLFPSLATGVIPAANFGETILVVRPDVILSSMAPYKKKGTYSAITFSTDIWSDTLGSFVTTIAALTWKQLHGSPAVNWYYCQHIYTLGPEIKETGFGGESAKPIFSTSKLAAAMHRKFKSWRRDLTFEQVTALSDQPSGQRYGYLETKCNIILGWDCIPLAVCPEQVADKVKSNLAKYGFRGKILAVPLEAEMLKSVTTGLGNHEQDDFMKYQYSWIVRDVIMEYAEKHNLFFNVTEG